MVRRPATSGGAHTYQVIALNESSAPVMSSNLAAGARAAAMITGYEVARDDGDWRATGPATTVVDEEAPLGTIAAEAEAMPRYPGSYTRLRVVREPTITPPRPAMYRVRAATSAGASPPSAPAFGVRGVGDVVSYQWERSVGDADTGYAPLPDMAGAHWFDAVSPVGRGWFYRAAMSASGAAGQTAGVRAAVSGFRSLSAGGTFACGLRFDDTVHCWGRTPDSVAGTVPAGTWPGTFKSVSVGTDHACAIRATDDKVICWGGSQQYGQAPPGPSSDRFKSISDCCGVRLDDKVVCWGDNAHGEAPPGPSADSFQSVSHVCGLRLDGRMVCWGDNSDGGAPPGPSSDRFKSISSSSGGFGCGVRLDDKVVCWGNNQDGQAPAGPSADSFQSVSTGEAFACGVRADGRVVCWEKFQRPGASRTVGRHVQERQRRPVWPALGFRLRRADRRPGGLLGVQRRRPGAALAASGVIQERERRRRHRLRDSLGRQARLLGRQRFERASAAGAVGPLLQERQRRSVPELRREIR